MRTREREHERERDIGRVRTIALEVKVGKPDGMTAGQNTNSRMRLEGGGGIRRIFLTLLKVGISKFIFHFPGARAGMAHGKAGG